MTADHCNEKTKKLQKKPNLSIRSVRNECELSCSLDSCGKLSLVISAAACYSSGQDLCALCHKLLEFSYIFVIDELTSVSAELANLFAGALDGVRSSFGSFSHDTFTSLLDLTLICVQSESQNGYLSFAASLKSAAASPLETGAEDVCPYELLCPL